MLFGGFQKTTLVDYPGRVASIAFAAGCNMRCHYCYNSNLVFRDVPETSGEFILYALAKRKRLVDSVVITGGEPTIWSDLPEFLQKLRNIGMSIKLDTNGTNPKALKRIFDENLVDYVAMDIKAPWDAYQKITGVNLDTHEIKESMRLIKERASDYEFRTTLAPGLTIDDLASMAEQIKPARRWLLQQFSKSSEIINPAVLSLPAANPSEVSRKLKEFSGCFGECRVRNF